MSAGRNPNARVMGLRDRIWFRQTAYTIGLGLVLGLLLSIVTISLDLVEERKAARDRAIQVVEVMRKPAAQAVFNIDPRLARDVAEGLFQYRLFRGVSIIDDVDVELAQLSRPKSDSFGSLLADQLFGDDIRIRVVILHPGQDSVLGSIIVLVDSSLMAQQFFQRSLRSIVGALVRNVILSICLLALFYVTLTKPLVGLAQQISAIDPKSPEDDLKLATKLRATEFQGMIKNLNKLLHEFAVLHENQQATEDELRKHKDQLAHQIEARTAELYARNQDLTREIKERQQIEIALRNSKRAAEEASQAKSLFLSNMSHELRAPMTAILGFSQIMGKEVYGPLGNKQYLDYAKDIHKSGDHLLSLINELLDLSKIEAGEYELNEERVDLDETVTFVTDMMATSACEKSIALDRRIAERLPGLFADERSLRQIIINLVSNSIKFTGDQGKIMIQAELSAHNQLVLNVEDNGAGMSEQGLAKAFEPFGQVSGADGQNQQGTGLGLSITKELVELHQGEISIASEKGVGTRVTVTFPAERTLPPVDTAATPA